MTDMKAVGKRTVEWDLNDWRWDGDSFAATPVNPLQSDCRSRPLFPVQPEVLSNAYLCNGSSAYSVDINGTNVKAHQEPEKRRRAIDVTKEIVTDEAAALNLKLGGQIYPIAEDELDKWEGNVGKKTKIGGTSSNHPVCQVEGCEADLSNAKDYHRRHKVCDVHSKATSAMVSNVMQRFCQQCSRFHALEEFDEGKRSCRRRLAGHNKRRRKSQPEPAANIGPLNDERSSSFLLITLLRTLSNLHSLNSDQSKNQDLLSHFLSNLANLAGALNGSNIPMLLQGLPFLTNAGDSAGTSEKSDLNPDVGAILQEGLLLNSDQQQRKEGPSTGQSSYYCASELGQSKQNAMVTTGKRNKRTDIDLNNAYDESQDCVYNVDHPDSSRNTTRWAQLDSRSSPPQTSGNSGSSALSLSSSSGSDAQSRTDRIIFKLFGKDPSDLPHLLRKQILEWLAHSPTDIEGYIRPGCIVLTLYLRLDKASWEELCGDLDSSLSRLLALSDESFWRTGWIYARVQHRAAFLCDGHVVLDTSIPSRSDNSCSILSISPIALPASERAQFIIKGFNLSQSASRLQCALEGRYLVQESCSNLVEDGDTSSEDEYIQCLHFSCSIPEVSGRGVIEVEDDGLTGSFFPFIVAEPDVCSEIRSLERIVEVMDAADYLTCHKAESLARNQAIEFLHEMGWILHRSCLKHRVGVVDSFVDMFPFERLKWLLDYSVNHDWCGVVKKLLDIGFDGCVDSGDRPSVKEAVSEIGLLHTAVRRNNRPMVESLLRYLPNKGTDTNGKQLDSRQLKNFLFRPDVAVGGLTPLHVAASSDGFEGVLKALLEDPGGVGIEAWKSVRCGAGLTANDYASLRGKYSYIDLVKKISMKKLSDGHVVIDIPKSRTGMKQTDNYKSGKIDGLETESSNIILPVMPIPQSCGCDQKLQYRYRGTTVAYRPAMLSLLAIAAVCVCVALLFKSGPEVYVFKPFRWNELQYGAM